VTTERARLAQTASKEYEACAKAFEALALRHTLPDAVGVTTLKLDGARYEALLQCHTPYGLEWSMELDIPASSPLARVLRVDRLIERLDVDAPEEGGWLHKEVRNRPQRLDRLHLAGLSVHPSETAIRLRANDDGSGPGFDILVRNDPTRVELVRIVEGGTATEPFNVVGDDQAKLQSLRDAVVAIAGELATQKKALRQATLEGTPIHKLESPRAVVERIIANIAPVVHEIASRSLAPGELVIKRLLDDSRREEVFVSKKELEQKVETLPRELRAAFDPLQLWSSMLPSVIVARDVPRPAEPAATASDALAGSPIQVISSPPPPIDAQAASPPSPRDGESFPPPAAWPTRPPRA
jgi:hypothetical protein